MSAKVMTAIRCDIIDDSGPCGRELVDHGEPTTVRRLAAEQGWTRRGWADVCDDHARATP